MISLTIDDVCLDDVLEQFVILLFAQIIKVFLDFGENVVLWNQNGHRAIGIGHQIGQIGFLDELGEFAVFFVALDQLQEILNRTFELLIHVENLIPEDRCQSDHGIVNSLGLVAPAHGRLDEAPIHSYRRRSEPNEHN